MALSDKPIDRMVGYLEKMAPAAGVGKASYSPFGAAPTSGQTTGSTSTYFNNLNGAAPNGAAPNGASLNGAAFYGLPANEDVVTLEREAASIPDTIELVGSEIVPFHGGQTLGWRFVG